MPKKEKPSFKIPKDIEPASQSGWVYRSDHPAAPVEPTPEHPPEHPREQIRSVKRPDPFRPLWTPFALFYSLIQVFVPSGRQKRES